MVGVRHLFITVITHLPNVGELGFECSGVVWMGLFAAVLVTVQDVPKLGTVEVERCERALIDGARRCHEHNRFVIFDKNAPYWLPVEQYSAFKQFSCVNALDVYALTINVHHGKLCGQVSMIIFLLILHVLPSFSLKQVGVTCPALLLVVVYLGSVRAVLAARSGRGRLSFLLARRRYLFCGGGAACLLLKVCLGICKAGG